MGDEEVTAGSLSEEQTSRASHTRVSVPRAPAVTRPALTERPLSPLTLSRARCDPCAVV